MLGSTASQDLGSGMAGAAGLGELKQLRREPLARRLSLEGGPRCGGAAAARGQADGSASAIWTGDRRWPGGAAGGSQAAARLVHLAGNSGAGQAMSGSTGRQTPRAPGAASAGSSTRGPRALLDPSA